MGSSDRTEPEDLQAVLPGHGQQADVEEGRQQGVQVFPLQVDGLADLAPGQSWVYERIQNSIENFYERADISKLYRINARS